MRISRRAVLAGMATTVLAGGRAFGDGNYPSRPIQIIVPATAGGQSDIGARRIGELLHEALGQPIVIDNRTGAGGSIATTLLSRAEKDGYTAAKHQHEVGTGYFDEVARVIAGGECSTVALAGSTEAEQFR